MEIIIIGASMLAFLGYIALYRYFGIDAKIQMVVIHALVLAFIALLVVLLSIPLAGNNGNLVVTSAVAAITGFSVLFLKYLIADLAAKKS